MDIIYIALGVLLIGICFVAYQQNAKTHRKRELNASSTEQPVAVRDSRPAQPQEIARTFVPGPKLTRDDDALFAVVYAAIAQTLAREGVNPEGGFAIRALKPVYDTDQPPLSLRENEALYAVIAATIAKTLAAEGINPEGGFVIRSVQPV